MGSNIFWLITVLLSSQVLFSQVYIREVGTIRGITLAPVEDPTDPESGYGREESLKALYKICSLGANWVSITPFARMDDLNSVRILPYFNIPWPEKRERLLNVIRQAHAIGLKVALIPHIWIDSGAWRGDINPGDSKRWDIWFKEYERFILSLAKIAQVTSTEMLSIGVEFKSSSNLYADKWKKIIAKVRGIFDGLLTYSANWDEVDDVGFWDSLDMIGINAFYPLSCSKGQGKVEMGRKALAIKRRLSRLVAEFRKPVLFTEIGYRSMKDSTCMPWKWPEHLEEIEEDETLQAEAMEVIFEVFTSCSWFRGMFWWKYFSNLGEVIREGPGGFSFMQKKGEKVIRAWFKIRWPGDKRHPWDPEPFKSLKCF